MSSLGGCWAEAASRLWRHLRRAASSELVVLLVFLISTEALHHLPIELFSMGQVHSKVKLHIKKLERKVHAPSLVRDFALALTRHGLHSGQSIVNQTGNVTHNHGHDVINNNYVHNHIILTETARHASILERHVSSHDHTIRINRLLRI